MQDTIQGTFHFHSTYSHDGRSTLSEIATTLREQGLSFCLMTEHFEDFDEPKFDQYLLEIDSLNKSNSFLLVPGMEVSIGGLHTIVFPVRDFGELRELSSGETPASGPMFKVLAHPSKYPFPSVIRHLQKYRIDGIELWNQQSDGSYLPPFRFLESLKTYPQRSQYRYFFGCDIHNVHLTARNILSVPAPKEQTTQAIVDALISGDFISRNKVTGIDYRNGTDRTDYDTWIKALSDRPFYRAKLKLWVRRRLRSAYKIFPRQIQHSLNDFKNFVRDKV